MIKYIGSKRTLVPAISNEIQKLTPTGSVIDLFSGTSRVGYALKALGYKVLANDLSTYAATIGMCYVQSDREDVETAAKKIIDELNLLSGDPGYFTQTFCQDSRYFQPKNGARVDAIRNWIETSDLEPELRSVILVSLMEAADRVDSTTGVQMAYLKEWASRANKDIHLRVPKLLSRAAGGKGRAFQMEAQEAAQILSADVAYLDPPYNQHKYAGNYHIWETLMRWDAPEAYGIAKKRIDCKESKSDFNSKPKILEAMRRVVKTIDARHIVVSFNNEGYISKDDMIELLSERGEVRTAEYDYKRYVGAQIGIHNQSGEKVGEVSHLRNKEYLFIVKGERDR